MSIPLDIAYTSSTYDEFFEGICNLCFIQLNIIVNSQNKIPDLIFTNMPDILVSQTDH